MSSFDFGINIPDDDEEFSKLCEERDERFGTEFTNERDIDNRRYNNVPKNTKQANNLNVENYFYCFHTCFVSYNVVFISLSYYTRKLERTHQT